MGAGPGQEGCADLCLASRLWRRTGDPSALPTIQRWVDSATKAQYLDGWAGRGGVAHVTYGGGGGHLNAGGTAVVTFLMLAKECGVKVEDHALHGALTHFYRYAGRGNNPTPRLATPAR